MPDKKYKKIIVNHDLGKIIMPNGNSYNFADCIKSFDFPLIKGEEIRTEAKEKKHFPKINLKIISLSQINALEEYILKNSFNPLFSLEYGEIIHPIDLSKYSAEELIDKVNNFCKKYNIKFRYSTPKELIVRDFSRVFDTAKIICKQIDPHYIIINNRNFLKKFILDKELKNTNIEIGCGIDLTKQNNIKLIKDSTQIKCIDLSGFSNFKKIRKFLQKIKSFVLTKRLTVCGSIAIESEGLCPLNSSSAEKSRINCNVACRKDFYAIKDCFTNNVFPFISDGFCRMHLYEDKILDLSSYIQNFEKIGIDEFTIDMSVLKKEFVSVLLTRFINNPKRTTYKELKTIPKDTL